MKFLWAFIMIVNAYDMYDTVFSKFNLKIYSFDFLFKYLYFVILLINPYTTLWNLSHISFQNDVERFYQNNSKSFLKMNIFNILINSSIV